MAMSIKGHIPHTASRRGGAKRPQSGNSYSLAEETCLNSPACKISADKADLVLRKRKAGVTWHVCLHLLEPAWALGFMLWAFLGRDLQSMVAFFGRVFAVGCCSPFSNTHISILSKLFPK